MVSFVLEVGFGVLGFNIIDHPDSWVLYILGSISFSDVSWEHYGLVFIYFGAKGFVDLGFFKNNPAIAKAGSFRGRCGKG